MEKMARLEKQFNYISLVRIFFPSASIENLKAVLIKILNKLKNTEHYT